MFIKDKMMDLEKQFLSLGMTPAQAKEHADNFVKGLQELGLSNDKVEANNYVEIVKNNNNLENVLLKIGVKPTVIQKYATALDQAMVEFGIDTKLRQAMFLAQILHESSKLTAVEENLNYSEQGLIKTFKKYFDRARAARYARNPQKIANRVYANRMGNGNEDSGDGWRFRGRGLIQLTGRNNYIAFGKEVGMNLVKNPDYLLTPEGAARSAGWFWETNKLNVSADKRDIVINTQIINGGSNGLDDRTRLYNALLKIM